MRIITVYTYMNQQSKKINTIELCFWAYDISPYLLYIHRKCNEGMYDIQNSLRKANTLAQFWYTKISFQMS